MSEQLAIKGLCKLLGLEPTPDKEVAPTISETLLGAEIKLSRGFDHAYVHQQKVLALRTGIS